MASSGEVRLLQAIQSAQIQYIDDAPAEEVFERLLAALLDLTESEYGFIGEVLRDDEHQPYVKVRAITNIAWDEATRRFFDENAPSGLEFRNLETLFGRVMTTGEAVISNDPSRDPRRGGLPPGHPALNAFLGLPIYHREDMVGMLGIANRANGYDPELVSFLSPFLATCAGLLRAHRTARERRRAEDELRRMQKIDAVGTLAGGVAHDFNNILYVIMANAELAMQRLADGDPARKNLDEILASAQRGADVADRILLFSRGGGDSGGTSDAAEVVAETREFLAATLPSSTEILFECDPGRLVVPVGAADLQQILVNLCTNASHAMPDGGRARVRVERVPEGLDGDEALVLFVTDRGRGIAAGVRERVFEPYFTTKPRGKGTGLGLSVVHGIVQSAGGTVEIRSEEGTGTEVEIRLPLVSASTGEMSTTASGTDVPRGSERILFVDDEPRVARVGRELLESLGYRVEACTSSREALDSFHSSPRGFDLVLTDQTMPHMTGAALARAVLEIRPDIPVVLCTGLTERLDPEQWGDIGIHSFLRKPLAIAELAASVRRALDDGAGMATGSAASR